MRRVTPIRPAALAYRLMPAPPPPAGRPAGATARAAPGLAIIGRAAGIPPPMVRGIPAGPPMVRGMPEGAPMVRGMPDGAPMVRGIPEGAPIVRGV